MNENKFFLRSGEDVTEYVKHPVLLKYRKLLENFENEGIFCVFHSESDGFFIQESCDGYYGRTLTKEDCLSLSDLFKDIAASFDR